MPNLAARLGGWSARHRLTAIAGWLVLVAVAMLVATPSAGLSIDYNVFVVSRIKEAHDRISRVMVRAG